MAAQKGLEMLLKVGDGASPEVFSTIAGGRSTNLSINNTQVEITSQDDTGRFRALLAGAGVRSVSVTLEGVFKDDAAIATTNTAALADTHDNWQVIVPDFGTFTGAYQIGSVEYAGEQDGEVTYNISLESAGTITFAAV